MPKEFKPGCARPVGSPTTEPAPGEAGKEAVSEGKTEKARQASMIRVGKKAPDFTAPAYIQGKFASVQLSEYLGKWVLLCFYPGDFTFV